jgi:NhaA family Na+:H+ antiporter
VGILTGTVAAAVLAAVVLRLRNRRYARIEAAERRDDDHDGIPDLFEHPPLSGDQGGNGPAG